MQQPFKNYTDSLRRQRLVLEYPNGRCLTQMELCACGCDWFLWINKAVQSSAKMSDEIIIFGNRTNKLTNSLLDQIHTILDGILFHRPSINPTTRHDTQ